MSALNSQSRLFKSEASKRSDNAIKITTYHMQENNLLFSAPYSNTGYHLSAGLYPFIHAVKFVVDFARLIPGTILYIRACAENNNRAKEVIEEGLVQQVGAVVFDLLNIALSLVAFISRTFQTIIYGYPHNLVKSVVQDSATETFGNNWFANNVGSLFGSAAGAMAEAGMSMIDEDIHNRTYQF